MKTYTSEMHKRSCPATSSEGIQPPLTWIVVSCLALSSSLASADVNDTFSPYLSAGYGYNSNLFLLQNDQAAITTLGTSNKAESFHILAAGLNMNWKPGRQVITGHVEANKVNFDTYKILDYNGHDVALKWNWLVNEQLTGEAGISEIQKLAPFLYTKRPLYNLLTSRNVFLNSNIKLNNRWLLKLGTDKAQYSYTDVTQQNNDLEINSYNTGIRYSTPRGSKFDFNSSVSYGDYPNQINTTNKYTQYDNGISFDWNSTEKTRVYGKVNYTSRKYPNAQQRDYSGITGRASADWLVSGKTTLSITAFRDIGTYITDTSSYQITQGVSGYSLWHARSDVDIKLSARHESIDYLSTPNRLDKLSLATLDITYTLLRNTTLEFVAERGVRSSNIDGNSYGYNSVTVGLNHAF